MTYSYRLNKCSSTSLLPLILTHKIHLAETFPTESPQFSKVVKLQNATITENFNSFFGVTLIAVGKIVYHSDRPIFKNQCGRSFRRRRRCRPSLSPSGYGSGNGMPCRHGCRAVSFRKGIVINNHTTK